MGAELKSLCFPLAAGNFKPSTLFSYCSTQNAEFVFSALAAHSQETASAFTPIIQHIPYP
jgi:hypothetical protein